MKKVFIIHGWEGYPEEVWFPWLKQELEKRGFSVIVPEMPDTESPVIEDWVSYLEKIVGIPDNNTYFVGHSIGCQTIMRYLEKIDNIKIGGAVFVAGWFNLIGLTTDEELEIAKPWLEIPINLNKVKEATNNFTAIFSSNDPYVPLKDQDIFKEKLGAKIIIEKDKGHFDEGSGVKNLPSVLNNIIELLS